MIIGQTLLLSGMTDHKSWVILWINLDIESKELLTGSPHKSVFKIYISSDKFHLYSDGGSDLFQTQTW